MTKSTDAPAQQLPAAAPAQDPNLSIQDLATATQIISVVVSRGAIKAEEMQVVGALYNKLNSFLQASEKAKAQADEAAAQAAEEQSAKEAKPKTVTAKKKAAEKPGAAE